MESLEDLTYHYSSSSPSEYLTPSSLSSSKSSGVMKNIIHHLTVGLTNVSSSLLQSSLPPEYSSSVMMPLADETLGMMSDDSSRVNIMSSSSSSSGVNTIMDLSTYDILNSTSLTTTPMPSGSGGSRDESLAKIEIAVLSAIFLSILIGNVPVVITIIFGKLGRTRMYYFLLHLCFADLITAFFNVIPQLAWEITHHFHGGNFLCKSVKYLQILGPYLSSYTLTAMSIDRYLAICHPLTNNHLSLHRAKRSILISWIISLTLCSPQAYIFSYEVINSDGLMECWATFPFQPWGERFYVTWYAVTVFFIPFIVIFFTNFRICWELWRASRERRLTKKSRKQRELENSLLHPHNDDQNQSVSQNHRSNSTRTSSIKKILLMKIRRSSSSTSASHDNQQNDLQMKDLPSSKSNGSSPQQPAVSTSLIMSHADEDDGDQNDNHQHHNDLLPKGVQQQQQETSLLMSPQTQIQQISTPTSVTSAKSGVTKGRHHLDATNRGMSLQEDGEHRRAKIKSVKLTVTVILCYVFCSLPFILVQLWAYWYPGAQQSPYWSG